MTVSFSFSHKPKVEKLSLQPEHRGQCHCGGVVFTVSGADRIGQPMRCNCSICKRHAAIMGFVEREQLRIEQGHELLTLYQFNTGVAEHYFCSRCGIYTHHRRRSIPRQYAFNLACLDGVDPYTLADVPIIDGEGAHPSER